LRCRGSSVSDNGTELTSNAILRFIGRLRDELLNETLFRSLPHARALLETWRIDYNCASEHPSVYVIEEKRFC
jgi:putative transposase